MARHGLTCVFFSFSSPALRPSATQAPPSKKRKTAGESLTMLLTARCLRCLST